MTVVHETEWTDFRGILKTHGYAESDFELREVEDVANTAEPSPVTGTLTITRKGLRQTYRIGHGSDWLSEFEGDLVSGVFGS